MKVPDWYALLLLGGATFRVWRLIAEDDITDPIRRYVTRLGPDWQKEGDPIPSGYRVRLMKFLLCPWCSGFYIAAGWWLAWLASENDTLAIAALASLTLFPALVERLVSSD